MPNIAPSIEIINPKEFATVAADEIHACIDESIYDHGRCSLVLAGGKTPSSIYRILSRHPKVGEIDWEKLYLYWGDERWVPKDHNQSNFRMVNETLLSHLTCTKPKYYPIDTSLPSAEEAALKYESIIREVEGLQNGQLPQFDVVLLGMGADGHIASIFPGSPLLDENGSSGKLCDVSRNPADGGIRVTMTPAALLGARQILFMIRGEHKADMVKKTLEEEGEIKELPARLYRKAKGSVTWLLDSSAAAKLSKAIGE